MAKTNRETAPERTETSSNRPSHDVFVVTGEGENAFWTKIGGAWAHNDGNGFNVKLISLPLDGRLVIRIRKED